MLPLVALSEKRQGVMKIHEAETDFLVCLRLFFDYT